MFYSAMTIAVRSRNRDFIHENRRDKAGVVIEFADNIMAEAKKKATTANENAT